MAQHSDPNLTYQEDGYRVRGYTDYSVHCIDFISGQSLKYELNLWGKK